ncbi:FAD-binding oxidoreductase [Ornithinimicrobium sediminis]|uniref:FAD-binding oxidoreductase n=1 Tax=Ornithinimicrobium sediminis TaxID=2904603 RepID=UPI001E2ED236|nr:FAD-binding oxidoreductase [Ornithinimicrobium sediminis]MCE0486838.1 FAD-binding oxidoreductase [Ornithinimicrobium sediminis]
MTTHQGTLEVPELEDLRAELSGVLLEPDDPDYDDARRVWNGMVDVSPRALVRAWSTEDVDHVIDTVRRTGLPLAVRGGGHNIAGHGTVEGGIVLDMSPLRDVSVDPDRRLVTVGAGATLADVDAATAPHGLAVPVGVVGGTGIAGLTLGGGVGWLTHSDGLTIDHLVAAELVTAEGEHLHVDEQTHPDLLWGLRGGGGNFGVVTSFTFRARPLRSPAYVGNLVYARPHWRSTLRAVDAWTATLPDAMNVIVSFLVPPPQFEMGDEAVMIVAFAWASDDHDEGRAVVRDLTDTAPPDDEETGPLPWTQWQTALDEAFPKGSRGYWKNASLSRLDDEVLEVVVSYAEQLTWVGTGIDLHHLEGAFARVPEDATAFPNRSARFWLNIYGFWQDPEEDERLSDFARRMHAALAPFAEQGEYVNFLGAERGADADQRARASYGEATWRRLVTLKDQYDPDNLFRGNQNITPSRPARS